MELEIMAMTTHKEFEEIVAIVRVGKSYYGFSESTDASTLSKLSIKNDKDLKRTKRYLGVTEREIVLPYFNQELFMDMYQQMQEEQVNTVYREKDEKE